MSSRMSPERRRIFPNRKSQDSGINWDVIGFSSAAVTLLGAAILYLIGWVYEVNWYAFFGISMTHVSISPQQVIAQSFSPLINISVMFQMAFSFYAILKDWPRSKVKLDLEELLIFFVAITAVATLISVLLDLWRGKIGLSLFDGTASHQLPGELRTMGLVIIYFVILFLIAFSRLWITIWKKHDLDEHLETYRVKYNKYRIVYLAFIVFVFTLGISAVRGMEDAASGVRFSGGWVIPKAYIVSSNNMNSLIDLHQGHNVKARNVYGPFALIAENPNSYFLIKWKNDNRKYFQRDSGLYIMPRDGLAIIPDNNPALPISMQSPTAIVTPESTQTATFTSSPTIAAQSTARPILTLTTNAPQP